MRIIGNMTGNSMDAIDLVLTEFDNGKMADICSYTRPYSQDMQEKIENLRVAVFNKTRAEIEALPEFEKIHDDYIRQIAETINDMCAQNQIDKSTIDAIGFHGKTLDHNPPSKAARENTLPYTLQIGSGQMLADLTGIPVVYDFRSDFLMNGFEGAPLVPPHNAHISAIEGDGCYYNGGNTSNFALIMNGKAVIGTDAGPCNEYTDNYIRRYTGESFDKDGKFGRKGKLNSALLQKLFNFGRNFYEASLPKSGDPAYYHKNDVFEYAQQNVPFNDAVHTFEYFAAYIAVHTLSLVSKDIPMPADIVLFGGGWKNPVVMKSFEDLLLGKGMILPEHEQVFSTLLNRFETTPKVRFSAFGDYMEARLFADLADCKLKNKAWELPETRQAAKQIICGRIAHPSSSRQFYDDRINRAAKGWQKEKNI